MVVFATQTLDLPIEPSESRSNSEGSGSHRKHVFHLSIISLYLASVMLIATETYRISFYTLAESVDKQSQQQQQQQSSIQYISGDKPSPLISSSNKPGDEKVTPLVPGDNYSYVQITDVSTPTEMVSVR